ncbi:winged helix-turn-helix domain-containing protein [bacterium]|nr:winged helix-turn-helix domain-containing protein [bacterium]
MMEVAKKIKGARLRLRVQAIALLKKGWHQKDVAEAVGAGIRTVRDWAFRYNKEGIESLYNKPRSGAPRKLKDSIGFKQRVLAGSDYKQDNIVSWNGQKLQEVLRKEFNADYSLSGVYLVLHRLELRWLMPRPYHPKANTELQEAFKKTLKIK